VEGAVSDETPQGEEVQADAPDEQTVVQAKVYDPSEQERLDRAAEVQQMLAQASSFTNTSPAVPQALELPPSTVDYKVDLWNGYAAFLCRYCPFTTLRKDVAEEHPHDGAYKKQHRYSDAYRERYPGFVTRQQGE
jgi:hypothetical protein